MNTDRPESVYIEDLARHRAWAPRLAVWHHAQWGHLQPGDTLDARIRRMEQAADGEGGIPAILVAHDGNKPLGSASLVMGDLADRPDLNPWLASVFVRAECRRRGIGEQLVRAVMERARALHCPTLYLITPDRSAFYARLGWREVERRAYRGERVTLMQADLDGG